MKRRQFVKASLVGGGVILGVGAGAFTLIKEGNKNSLTVEMALKNLDDLSDESLIHQGEWNPYQIFTHCAQSVEFSMSEFPEHKSNLFKSTVGQLAFSIFASKGKMTHDLGEPIPSAPIIIKHLDSAHALIRLKQSLLNFSRYQGILAPHFAYGELSKAEYEIAHVMHLYNHLQEIKT